MSHIRIRMMNTGKMFLYVRKPNGTIMGAELGTLGAG